MSLKTIQTNKLQTRALIVPNSFNKENRTIEVVFATETPVNRRNWEIGDFQEVLEISTKAIDFSRLNNGAPALNTHQRYSLESVIGVVEKAWIDGKEAKALIRFSEREEVQSLINDIESGIIRNISVGYYVSEYTITEKDKANPIYRATRWQPAEISFVPIPADSNSGTRSDDNQVTNTSIINLMENENTQERQQENKPTVTAPATQIVDEKKIREEAVATERKRVADITDSCERAGLDTAFATSLINEGKTVDEARAAIIDKVHERANKPPVTATVTGQDETEQTRSAIIIGLSHRADPAMAAADYKDNVKAKDYRHVRMLDLAKDRLEAKGERHRGLSDLEIVQRAIATTDFPNLLMSVTERQLLGYYDSIIPTWREFGQQENVNDFRAKTGIRIDGDAKFSEVTEGGEYKESKLILDEKKSTTVKKYGEIVTITEKAIINDDLGVFNKIPQYIAEGAARMQSEMFWDLVINNRNSFDGTALFHAANHKNLAASGAALSETTLAAARLAIRRQIGPAKKQLGLKPKFLMVPPELETTAEKLLSAVLATTTGEVNTMAGKFQLVVNEALTDPLAWYVVADPATRQVDGLIYSFLNGAEGLQTEKRVNFNTDNLEIKAKLFFGVATWGHQGWYKNPGA